MNAIRVVTPGLLTTVQDLGRFHYADPEALRPANLPLGNADNAAAEMTDEPPGLLRMDDRVRFRPVAEWRP